MLNPSCVLGGEPIESRDGKSLEGVMHILQELESNLKSIRAVPFEQPGFLSFFQSIMDSAQKNTRAASSSALRYSSFVTSSEMLG